MNEPAPYRGMLAMQQIYQFIAFERSGDTFCVRLQKPHIEDHQMEDLGAELGRLIDTENCRRMVLNLGPDEPDCLISVFLAKLINLQRRLDGMGGALALAQASDYTRDIFRVSGIEKFFHFYPDQQSAVKAINAPGSVPG